MKPVGEPDAVAPHVRFDERGWETERCRMAQATAPILDSTSKAALPAAVGSVCTSSGMRDEVTESRPARLRMGFLLLGFGSVEAIAVGGHTYL
jgi:hypothetical protein